MSQNRDSIPAADSDRTPSRGNDFIRAIVADDVEAGVNGGRVVTRFPPEPNGYLHIGHATAVHLNFGVARDFDGRCHLRFDDTNPETEDIKYVEAITEDVRWLGYDWGTHLYFASDYFDQMYEFAEHLIREGHAYVDSSDEEQIREMRGTVAQPGKPSRYRDRTPEENLDLFRRMRAGEFKDGEHVLRAKIDLASPNMLLRDPLLYRIRHAHHYRKGDEWCIYPLYDFAQPIEDALECVTHSICTLEFENNRPLYDWIVSHFEGAPESTGFTGCRPHQYEFARRNLDYTVMSKRKLLELVKGGHVRGWDDPRMPTIAGLRRRGFTPSSIRAFADMAGVGRNEIRIDIGKLEFAIRDDLNDSAPRVMAVLKPLRVVLTNYPEGQVEQLDAPYFPPDIGLEGSRKVPFARRLYIDRDDFREDPPQGYHRLAPGREVRLRYAYVIRCNEVVRDEAGEIVELHCTYDEETRGGRTGGRKVKGTIQWVSAQHALPFEARLYDRLFTVSDPEAAGDDFKKYLNPESLVIERGAMVEPSVADDEADTRYQFERLGYFWRDPGDSQPDALVFNRTVTLRDTWSRRAIERGGAPPAASQKDEERARRVSGGAPQVDPGLIEPPRSEALARARERYVEQLEVPDVEAEILTREKSSVDLFESALGGGEASPRSVANWVVHELPREAGGRGIDQLPFTGKDLGHLVGLVDGGTLSSSAAREVLAEMVATGEDPEAVVERLGLRQLNDEDALREVVEKVIADNPGKVETYRGGKTGLMGYFMGQVMRSTGGRANPEIAKSLLQSELDG